MYIRFRLLSHQVGFRKSAFARSKGISNHWIGNPNREFSCVESAHYIFHLGRAFTKAAKMCTYACSRIKMTIPITIAITIEVSSKVK